MKLFLIVVLTGIVSMSASDCNKKDSSRYQGKLEIKGICMNYTISVVGEEPDSLDIEEQWTDENTGNSYFNVFALGNPCQFPKEINQGDTFYFTIDTSIQESCMVCEAYYPKPRKKINIKVETK